MNLQLNALWRRHHVPDWAAAAAAGLGAGAILMVLELAWVATFGGEGPWRTTHLVAAIALGPQATFTSEFNVTIVAVALLTHYVLGIAFAMALAVVVAMVHGERSAGSIEALGMAFGALLYFVAFHLMTAWMPWFVEMRGWATFIGHLVFGLSAAVLYWRLRRRGPDE